jgi:hypothetical protein
MNIQQAVDQIAAKVGIDAATAERAAGTLLSVIQQELDPQTSASLFAKLGGAEELATQHQVDAAGGGMLSSIASSLLGAKAGVLAAGFTQLEASGLTMVQIEQAALGIMTYIKSGAGADIAKQVASSIPMLGGNKA